MPLTDVTNTLTATITSTEQSTSNVPINRSTGNPSFNSNVGTFTTYRAVIAGTVPLSLPAGTVFQIYIKNLDPALSFIVNLTPTGQPSANVATLFPGDQLVIWQSPTNAGAGFTGVTVVTSNTTLMEFFFGG